MIEPGESGKDSRIKAGAVVIVTLLVAVFAFSQLSTGDIGLLDSDDPAGPETGTPEAAPEEASTEQVSPGEQFSFGEVSYRISRPESEQSEGTRRLTLNLQVENRQKNDVSLDEDQFVLVDIAGNERPPNRGDLADLQNAMEFSQLESAAVREGTLVYEFGSEIQIEELLIYPPDGVDSEKVYSLNL